MRHLPFYSDLLTRLGPAAARELTQHDDDTVCSAFERFHLKAWLPRTRSPDQQNLFSGGLDDEEDFADWRHMHSRTTRRKRAQHGEAGEEDVGKSRGSRSDCARDLSFQREIQTIELALRRREVLGVERWLQLQRCAAPGDRCFLCQE